MNLEPLLYWACERERIRKLKEIGADPPWTADPILRRFRFCNVRRRDDRVSQWLLQHVLTPENITSKSAYSFLCFSAFCRWVNWPPTIRAIIEAGLWTPGTVDWTAVGSKVDELQRTGIKAWTGAYMVRAKPGDNRGKGRFVAEDVVYQSLGPAVGDIVLLCNAQAGAAAVWERINSCLNWGSFMAGQVVADWSYTTFLKDAPDLLTWAPMGPGSKRGLNRLLGRDVKHKVTQEEWNSLLPDWRREVLAALGRGYDDTVTLHDIQNCLCEVDKYLRVKNGEGRPRATYKPETSF